MATDERLLDRDYEQWTGADREKVIVQWGSVDNAPGVEPPAAVRDRDPGTLPQDNGCFNVLELRGDSWTVLSVNELPAQL